MGLAARDWAWSLDLATPSTKLVMLCLAEHANDRGHCWPSVERVGEKTGLSRRSISRAFADLKDRGLLRIVTKNYRNQYALSIPKQCANMAHPMSQIVPSDEPNCPIYIEPSVEPKDEPKKTLGLTPKGNLTPLQKTVGELSRRKKEMKVEEILQTKEWQKLPKAKKESVLARVVKEWQVAVLDVSPNKVMVAPSMKEVGQLKHLITRVGAMQAKTLIRRCVADWEGFTYFAANGKAAPPEPHLGYLLTHVEIAVQWFENDGTEQKVKQSKGLKAYLPPGV